MASLVSSSPLPANASLQSDLAYLKNLGRGGPRQVDSDDENDNDDDESSDEDSQSSSSCDEEGSSSDDDSSSDEDDETFEKAQKLWLDTL